MTRGTPWLSTCFRLNPQQSVNMLATKSSTYLIVFNERGRHAIPALFDHLLQDIVSDSVRQTIPEANFGLTSGANVKVHPGQQNETRPDVTSALLASLQVVLPQQRLPMWGTGVTNDLDHPPR